jgi:hypothetical protein
MVAGLARGALGLAAFAWLLLPPPAGRTGAFAAPAHPDDPHGFLEAIYAKYTGRAGSDGVDLSSDAEIRHLFDPPLATLIIADRQKASRTGEPPNLDGDPFVDAQDWVISDLQITVRRSGETAKAEVRFTNLDQPVTIRLDLVRLADGWRIHEIDYGSTTLSRILTGR